MPARSKLPLLHVPNCCPTHNTHAESLLPSRLCHVTVIFCSRDKCLNPVHKVRQLRTIAPEPVLLNCCGVLWGWGTRRARGAQAYSSTATTTSVHTTAGEGRASIFMRGSSWPTACPLPLHAFVGGFWLHRVDGRMPQHHVCVSCVLAPGNGRSQASSSMTSDTLTA